MINTYKYVYIISKTHTKSADKRHVHGKAKLDRHMHLADSPAQAPKFSARKAVLKRCHLSMAHLFTINLRVVFLIFLQENASCFSIEFLTRQLHRSPISFRQSQKPRSPTKKSRDFLRAAKPEAGKIALQVEEIVQK